MDIKKKQASGWPREQAELTAFPRVPSSPPQHKRIDRKKFPELRSRADGALTNLEAFVEYRKHIV